jgi:uncharacterized protein (TIGR03118 family)
MRYRILSWRGRRVQPTRGRLLLEVLEDRTVPSSGFVETPLVSDIAGVAPHTDAALVNPWAFTPTSGGSFLINNNGTGSAAAFAADGTPLGAPIVVPPPAGSSAGTTSAPTGQVANATADFVIHEGNASAPASNLFATEDGTISGFNAAVDPSNAILAVDRSASGAVYKGLAMGSAGGANFLYATDFHNGAVDVFDTSFALHTFATGQFTDPNTPAGYAPFGIANINGTLYVTFAKQDSDRHDDVAGPGNGFIDTFSTSGQFLGRFASGTAAGGSLTALNSPWGMTVAPHGLDKFGGALLVGNFGDSHVSAFDLKKGKFLGQLSDSQGQPLVLDGGVHSADNKGLWGIGFGSGRGDAARTLFFASGVNDEGDGVFGMVTRAKEHHHAHGDDSDSNADMDIVIANSGHRGADNTPTVTRRGHVDESLATHPSSINAHGSGGSTAGLAGTGTHGHGAGHSGDIAELEIADVGDDRFDVS